MRRKLITFLLIATSLLLPARADARQQDAGPYLVRDINTHTSEYNKPLELMEAGPVSYFFGSGGQGVFGLWKTDGTQAGTSFVKALGLGTYNIHEPGNLSGMLGEYLFFSASDSQGAAEQHGVELWRTNGTSQGTSIVADLVQGDKSSLPHNFVEMGGKLYFIAGWALWRLDGPEAAPVHIWGNISNGYDQPNTLHSSLYVLGDHLFFSNFEEGLGIELWTSDGTPDGTKNLTDLNPGAASSYAYPLLAFNGRLYFSADNGVTGLELWSYEAATGNTRLVADINPSGGSSPESLLPMHGTVFFQANEPEKGSELYRLDGEVVTRVTDLNPGPASSYPFVIGTLPTISGERLLFSALGADQTHGYYVTDGTAAGTTLILTKEPQPTSLLDQEPIKTDTGSGNGEFYQSYFYFQNYTAEYGLELWRTDGTAAGTAIYSDSWPGPKDGNPYNFGACGSRLCFCADDGDHGNELWSTDGSQAGASMVADLNDDPQSSNPSEMTAAGSLVYFHAYDDTYGKSLWRTDGTNGGTIRLLSGMPFDTGPGVTFVPAGNRIYFVTSDSKYGEELWCSEGTPETTHIVADINPGTASASPDLYTAQGNILYFTANHPSYGRELWKTDGTATGTKLVADLFNGPSSSDIRFIQPFKGQVVFTVYIKDASQVELWSTDGTAIGTKKITDIDQPDLYQPFVEANGLLFIVTGGFRNNGLWQTDGTAAGTKPVPAPTCLGSYGEIRSLAAMNGNLYFINTGWNGQTYPEIPFTLARTRGAQYGVECVWETHFLFSEGGTSYGVGPMIIHSDTVIFNAPEPGFTQRIWISDGTSAGTKLFPGQVDSLYSLFPAGPFLYFRGNSPTNGEELWALSNDNESASLVKDIYPGLLSSSPKEFVYLNGRLFFTAADDQHGRELWVYDIPAKRLYLPAVSH